MRINVKLCKTSYQYYIGLPSRDINIDVFVNSEIRLYLNQYVPFLNNEKINVSYITVNYFL